MDLFIKSVFYHESGPYWAARIWKQGIISYTKVVAGSGRNNCFWPFLHNQDELGSEIKLVKLAKSCSITYISLSCYLELFCFAFIVLIHSNLHKIFLLFSKKSKHAWKKITSSFEVIFTWDVKRHYQEVERTEISWNKPGLGREEIQFLANKIILIPLHLNTSHHVQHYMLPLLV